MKNNGNLYSNLMAQSYELFEAARQESIKLMGQDRKAEIRNCWKKVIDVTRRATVVSSYKEFHLESAKKTAVIIMGLSCTGKTTVSRFLSKRYPEFEVIGFDEIGMHLLRADKYKYIFNPSLLDKDMVIQMGELIQDAAKRNKNVIIEGGYSSMNARGAVIKTLRTLGYKKIFLLSTLSAPEEIQETCETKRALIYQYANMLEEREKADFLLRTFYEDVIPEIEKSIDVRKVMDSMSFLNHVRKIKKQRNEEWLKDMVLIQVEYDLLLAGADLFAEWY